MHGVDVILDMVDSLKNCSIRPEYVFRVLPSLSQLSFLRFVEMLWTFVEHSEVNVAVLDTRRIEHLCKHLVIEGDLELVFDCCCGRLLDVGDEDLKPPSLVAFKFDQIAESGKRPVIDRCFKPWLSENHALAGPQFTRDVYDLFVVRSLATTPWRNPREIDALAESIDVSVNRRFKIFTSAGQHLGRRLQRGSELLECFSSFGPLIEPEAKKSPALTR